MLPLNASAAREAVSISLPGPYIRHAFQGTVPDHHWGGGHRKHSNVTIFPCKGALSGSTSGQHLKSVCNVPSFCPGQPPGGSREQVGGFDPKTKRKAKKRRKCSWSSIVHSYSPIV